MNSPHPPLSLREATAADLALINDMHVRSRAVTYRGQVSDHYLDVVMPVASLEDWARKLPEMLAGGGRILIAQSQGRASGFVCMLAADADGSVYINNLHALPEHKGRGVGSALLDAAEQWARACGARAMHLRVLESNKPAIGFYESRGWRCVERLEDRWGDSPIVALIYAIDLAPAA